MAPSFVAAGVVQGGAGAGLPAGRATFPLSARGGSCGSVPTLTFLVVDLDVAPTVGEGAGTSPAEPEWPGAGTRPGTGLNTERNPP